MKRIDQIPKTPEVFNCEKHGDYEVKYSEMRFGNVWVNESCSKCVVEEEEAKNKKDIEEKEEAEKERARSLRESKRVNAGISKRNIYKTFDDYICSTEGQHKSKNDVVKFRDSFPGEKSLLFVGGVGTGKTLLASALIDSLADKYDCRMSKVIDIVRHLKGTWRNDSDESECAVLQRYIDLDLLIIDEIGSQFGSDTEKLFIFDIIDGRYQEMKQTILISNLDVEGIKKVIGERCFDRLRDGGGSVIAFDWKSARK